MYAKGGVIGPSAGGQAARPLGVTAPRPQLTTSCSLVSLRKGAYIGDSVKPPSGSLLHTLGSGLIHVLGNVLALIHPLTTQNATLILPATAQAVPRAHRFPAHQAGHTTPSVLLQLDPTPHTQADLLLNPQRH